MIITFPKRIDPVLAIMVRRQRERREAEELGIMHIDRTAFWLRAAAVAVLIGWGIVYYLAKHP